MGYAVAGVVLLILSYAMARGLSWALQRRTPGQGTVTAPAGKTDTIAVASIVVGILSMFSCFFPLGTLAGGVVAMSLGLTAYRRATPATLGTAVLGVVAGVGAIAVGLIAWAMVLEFNKGPL